MTLQPAAKTRLQVVVVGGGTGTHTILRGLKTYHQTIDLTAVITMADSGGSTGRLRDEFGQLPVGDVRMALAALAADHDTYGELVRELFLYRFEKGEGLTGHNVGNLLLTVLTEMLGNETDAIDAAAHILRVRGRVVPVTAAHAHLQATYDDDVVVTGEAQIDEPRRERWPHRITHVELTPEAAITDAARRVLESADVIIFGPGDLFTSVLATTAASGFKEAVQASRAQTYFVSNLMTKAGQTTGMSVTDHLQALEAMVGRSIDVSVVNSAPLPAELLAHYAAEGEVPVRDDLTNTSQRVMRAPLLMTETVQTAAGDQVRRSLLRHDSHRLADTLYTDWNSQGWV